MDAIDVTKTKVWVRLMPEDVARLTQECLKLCPEQPKALMAQYERKDGWYEFSLGRLVQIFYSRFRPGRVAFEDNQIHLTCPF